MPYEWNDAPRAKTLTLWPHQSMTAGGFTWFIGATALMLTLPLFAVLGSAVAWVLMAFFLATIAAMWRAIMANRKDRSSLETLRLTDAHIDLTHRPPSGDTKDWHADRYWVSVTLRDDGPVEKYLTLRGGGREVELGAFLTPDEREALYDELTTLLAKT